MQDEPARPASARTPASRGRPFERPVPLQAITVATASMALPLCSPGAPARGTIAVAAARLPAYSR
jgi:hypothetical protein